MRSRIPIKTSGAPLVAIVAAALLCASAPAGAQATAAPRAAPQAEAAARQRPQLKAQPRPFSARVAVDVSRISSDDGDTIVIHWAPNDAEVVRILGIDTPETRHPEHDLPFGQPFGEEARAFLQGVLAISAKVEVLRASTLDPYGRTLGYLFVNGLNYSVLVVRARLAEESVSRYGDNGFPAEAAEVLAAAKAAGPLPFEPPGTFRARLRELSRWLKDTGQYPGQ